MRGWLAAMLLPLTPPALAADSPPDEHRTWQHLDRQLFDVGWNLAVANAPYCRESEPSLGIALRDIAAAADPGQTLSVFKRDGGIAVRAVASGSPAERAGIVPGAMLETVNEAMVADFGFTEHSDGRLATSREAIATELRSSPPPVVGWTAPDGTSHGVAIAPVLACRSRFELASSGTHASANGERVGMGPDFPAFAYPAEEFAAVVAHELAHILLGHQAWLDGRGRKAGDIRATEREADRLAPWLLANAGHDPRAAIRLLERMRPEPPPGGLFRIREGYKWRDRVKIIATEIEAMEPHVDAQSRADWSRHFVRDIDE